MRGKVSLFIDGQRVEALAGEKLLWAALRNGIFIPHLCAMEEDDLPEACCRLCFVEVTGFTYPVTACTQDVREGMEIRTRTTRVDRLVSTAFELLLSSHTTDCARCPGKGSCALQKIAAARELKLKPRRFRPLPVGKSVDESLGTVVFDQGKCVLCGRCVRADHAAGAGVIGFTRKGIYRRVSTFGDRPLAQTRCTGCRLCAEVCPVGAFTVKKNASS